MTTHHQIAARLPVLLHVLGANVHAQVGTRGRRERGDVPGWVLITMMTAALVAVLYVVAGDRLQQVFEAAIDRVSNLGG
ncbi:MAG TPA: hypothetical protein VFJ97_06210 [Dermatophilaceae bacterium]|nr:hypothetical protein [Dermatophilaceae bacterium]